MKLPRNGFAGAALLLCLLQPFAATAASCDGPKYHQYDYFVGNWNVFDHTGKQIARDAVTREVDGCALLERWYGKNSKGAGFSAYDASKGRWVQNFFQNDGSVLAFTGALVSDGMLFSGDDIPKPGAIEHNRVLFRRLSSGGFEEYWTVSTDGKVWKKVFDGFFRPSKRT